MVKVTKPALFVLIFILIIWPAGFLIFKAKSPEAKKVANLISTQGFLSTLQNTLSEACLAMTYMDRVDVVIVGNSLAYADIDPLVLSRQFDGQSVAVCAFPGWNTDFFDMFFKVLKEHNLAPKRIVWLIDDSSSIKFKIHDKRLESAKTIMLNDQVRNKTAQEWIENIGTQEQAESLLKTYQDRLSRHSKHITALSNEVVTEIILENEFKSEMAVNEILKTAIPLPKNKNKLQKLCANIRQRSIVFDIVIAPMPRTSDSDTQKEDTLISYYQENAGCARSIISESLEQWGLDNRYYLNRNLNDDYPYELWEDPTSFTQKYKALPTREQMWFYDASHLNGVGAVIFTKSLAEKLK